MTEQSYSRISARFARWLFACAWLFALGAQAAAQSAPGSPVLLTEGTGTTTRGVAYESVTFRSEPFSVVSPFNWNADKSNTRDQRTRVTLFAMNLSLLPGEGASALTADAQDAAGNIYPLKVEALTNPKYVRLQPAPGNPNLQVPTEVTQGWLYAVTLRLNDSMTDTLGDVLVRVSLHGLSSNRVRIAVGQAGGGPPPDSATEFISPAPAVEPAPLPPLTAKAYGPGEASAADITRLLEQATWGPKGDGSDVAHVQQVGIRAFLDEQFNAPVANQPKGSDWPDLPIPLDDQNQQCPTDPINDPNGTIRGACLRDNFSIYPVQAQFFKNSMMGQTQLRQRVAFALHQILVVSNVTINRPWWMTGYLQVLDRNAFGSYRTMLGEMTLNPSMGDYLDMNVSTATSPNENYAREIMQLFSVGTNQLNPDGTPVLDSQGLPIPTYSQTTVNELTRIFTGWRLDVGIPSQQFPGQNSLNYRDPMVPRGGSPGTHDTGTKNLFGTAFAGCPGTTGTANGTCARNELTAALDVIFNHPNTGPFVSKQLIQHLVTSNPSPAYVQRVASVFNNDCNGLYPESPCGARGNLKAVVRNILLDPEARGDVKTDPNYGKLREPAQYINNVLRAFNARASGNPAAPSDGVLGSRSTTDFPNSMDQPLFQPATVFSYYQPDYQVPGTKILGPAFQILSTSTTLRRANFVNSIVYTGVAPTTGSNTDRPAGTSLNFASLDTLATNDPTGGQLADQLNALLLHGTMSAQMRSAITAAVQSVGGTARQRVQTAVYLVLTSSQYEVQR